MKKLILSMVMVVISVGMAMAQDKADEVGFGVTGLRQNQELKVPSLDTFKINADTDSLGGYIDYTHFLKNKSVGITSEFAITFHDKVRSGTYQIPNGTVTLNGRSKVALGTYMAGLKFKPRNKRVAPYAEVLAGVGNENLGGITYAPTSSFRLKKWGFAFAVGGGIETRFNKDGKWRLKTGAKYVQTRFNDSFHTGNSQHNFRIDVGFVR